MDAKTATRVLATQMPEDKRKKRNTVDRTYIARGDSGFQTNEKEDALIEAIDMRRTLIKHADWIEKVRTGQVDVPQFLNGLAPDVAVNLLDLALNGSSDKVRLAAIQDMLDRAGYSKVQKVAAAVVDANAPREQLIAMIAGLSSKTKEIEIVDDTDVDQDQEE